MAFSTWWKRLSAPEPQPRDPGLLLDYSSGRSSRSVVGALQAATQSISEMSTAFHRGGYLGYVFIANYLGISVAYWLSFGLAFVNDGYSDVRWHFVFQCFPAVLLLLGIRMLPDTPRYLASIRKYDEAREVLEHVRGKYDAVVEREFLEIKVAAEDRALSSPIEFPRILAGRGGKPGDNLAQRAWLCLFLQIMASWTGITAVTAYSPVLLSAAGYPELTQNGLAGGLNTVGIVGTIVSAQIVDRFGRRKCLMGDSLALFAVNVIAGRDAVPVQHLIRGNMGDYCVPDSY